MRAGPAAQQRRRNACAKRLADNGAARASVGAEKLAAWTRRQRSDLLFPLRWNEPVCLPYVRSALRTRLLYLARLQLQGLGVTRFAIVEKLFRLLAAAARLVGDSESLAVPGQLDAQHCQRSFTRTARTARSVEGRHFGNQIHQDQRPPVAHVEENPSRYSDPGFDRRMLLARERLAGRYGGTHRLALRVFWVQRAGRLCSALPKPGVDRRALQRATRGLGGSPFYGR